jgi:cyclic-di-AMP phosphodiesterase PgpH
MDRVKGIYQRTGRRAGVFLMFLISAVIIVYLFPREGKFRYEFQKGKPWLHETLIAPFSFPIYKLEAELAAERDSVLKLFVPYFNADTTIINKAEEEFLARFEIAWEEFRLQSWVISLGERMGIQIMSNQIEQYKSKHINNILVLLKNIYGKGIIEAGEISEKLLSEQSSFVVLRNNVGERREINAVFTQKTAYQYLRDNLDSLSGLPAGLIETRVQQFLNSFDYNELIFPNLFYDEVSSNRVKESMLADISEARGMVQSGERIISKGDLVNGQSFIILESLKREYETKYRGTNMSLLILGQSILVVVTLLVLFLFLRNFRREVLKNVRKTSFVLFLLLIVILISLMVLKYDVINFYVIPFAIVPIIMRTFYDERLALFVHTIGLLIVGLFAPNAFEFVFLNFIVGIVAIFSLSNIHRRSKLFYSAIIIVFTYSFLYFGFDLIKERSISGINWFNFAWFGGNGLLVLTCYPLIYFFEKIFGFLSDATLMELSDTNQPLLRQLAEEAPGTFQHSIQVANLAEAASYKIGGNPLLVRTGALYHDIGKMANPKYFIENQAAGLNPHDSLPFEESAAIIISHVTKGVEMGQKHKLPEQIIDFIRTHHGNTRVQYFYKSFLKKHPDQSVQIDQFTYPGPKPFSKETAVVMMADSVEAASRSLKNPDEETLDQLVESIINYQVIEEQFSEANITFKDISTIKEIFKNKLRNIYHIRIAYPV